MYYVYIIESKKTGQYYTGQTSDLQKRIDRHNSGRVVSTRNGRPWKLKYSEELDSRQKAVILEGKLKALKKREALEKYMENNARGVAQSG